MKYYSEMTEKFCASLKKLKGRVKSCKQVGIAYDTFLEWMERKPEFAEAVKKAEEEAGMRGKEQAIQAIFGAMNTSWQSAAWWLERKFSDEFALKQKMELAGKDGKAIIFEWATKKENADNYNSVQPKKLDK